MSEINFCNTKEQLNHLGEVVTGKVDGSPSGADIDTSTLPYTGQVRKTLPALEAEYQEDIDNFNTTADQVIGDKTAEFDNSIASKESEADAAIDAYRLLSKGPYASGVTLEDKFQFITYNGESYFATNPPYTTTATPPDADGNLTVKPYLTEQTADKRYAAVFKSDTSGSAIDNMIAGRINGSLTVTHELGDVFSTGSGVWEVVSTPVTGLDDFKQLQEPTVFDFGAKGDGSDDSLYLQDMESRNNNIVNLGDGNTFKGNFTAHGGGFIVKGRSVLQPFNTVFPSITVSNNSWNYGLIAVSEIDGVNKTGVGVGFDTLLSGRVKYDKVTFRRNRIGVYKSLGNIGATIDTCQFRDNTFGYLAVSAPASEGIMHCGNDIWIGGEVEENGIGIVYLNKVGGGGGIQINGTIVQFNETNAILYSITQGFTSFAEVNSLWNEAAYLRGLEPELIESHFANEPYFDSNGKWIGDERSVTTFGDVTFSNLGFVTNQAPNILSPAHVGHGAIFDQDGAITPSLDTYIDSASFDSGWVFSMRPYRVNRVKSVKYSTVNRGSWQALPEGETLVPSDNLSGSFGAPDIAGEKIDSSYAVIPESAVVNTLPFSGIVEAIPDVVSDADTLIFGVTLTRQFSNATNSDLFKFFLYINGANTNSYMAVAVDLSELTLNVPTRFILSVGGFTVGDTVGIRFRRDGQQGDVQVQDAYQYTTPEESALGCINGRIVPSNNGVVFNEPSKDMKTKKYKLPLAQGATVTIPGVQGVSNGNSMLVFVSSNNSGGNGVSELFMVDMQVLGGAATTSQVRVAGSLTSGITFSHSGNDLLVTNTLGATAVLTINTVLGF